MQPSTTGPEVPEEPPVAVSPQAIPAGVRNDHPSLYFNRELGWLDFNWRVLQQARDERLPLLERVRFIGISCSNLDEFFQKRVGGLKRQEVAGLAALSVDGRSPGAQLALIRKAARLMMARMTRVWEAELRPLLREKAGITISSYDELTMPQHEALRRHFREHLYPVLTPLVVDPAHPFPFISNLSLSLAIRLRHRSRGTPSFVRLKVPPLPGRWLRVPESSIPHHFVPVEDVLRNHVEDLFPGMEVRSVDAFRVTRNADIHRDDEETEDLLALVSEELRERRFAPVVRLEVEDSMSSEVLDLLLRELELPPEDVYEVRGLLGLADCESLAALELPEHRFEPWEPVVPKEFTRQEEDERESVFSILRRGDVLVHHPYDSFSATVQRLIEEAANDPAVVAIKQTLYRTSDNSPTVGALMRAAERGKQVAVLVEVTARFEEARNIEWAQVLEDGGVHVSYGVLGLKTHAKVLLVIRYEEGVPRVYCHLGTGNYHVRTARQYSDLGLLTADPAIGSDIVKLFHSLTGQAPDQRYGDLLVAPRDMRQRFIELIRREVEHQRAGRGGRITAKFNALDDPELIRELYAASQAGVRIDLIVRGHCRLRPGLAGFSDTIRVRSIIGRFLEHDRLYCFHNAGAEEVFIGSADWRGRNLDRRVEAILPVRAASLRARLLRILELALADNVLAWELRADGRYVQCRPRPGEPAIDLQKSLMADARERAGGAGEPWGLRAL